MNAAIPRYLDATRSYPALFQGLTVAHLDVVEERDADAPAALVAERMRTLADWQAQLRLLRDAVEACGDTAAHRFLGEQVAAYRTAIGTACEAFTRWHFGGWSALPDPEDFPQAPPAGRGREAERDAVRRAVDAQFPTVAAFLAAPTAGDREVPTTPRPCCPLCSTPGDFGRVDYAEPTSGLCPACIAKGLRWTVDRTHTIPLLDAPGATLTVTCPSWCTDTHAEEATRGVHAVDFAHHGYEHALPVGASDDRDEVLLVQVHQYPFGSDLRKPAAVLWPTLGTPEAHLDPDGLCALADRLRQYADELVDLSLSLAHARTEHRAGGAR